jgi:hypothetical protein
MASMLLALGLAAAALAESPAPTVRQFQVGSLRQLEELPVSRLRTQLEGLPANAQQRALRWLQSAHFTEWDLPSLHADSEGGIFYVCDLAGEVGPVEAEAPPVGQASVPVDPFPAGLIFHSRPSAPNVLYLNFAGERVSSTVWNNTLNRSLIPAVPFSTDSDATTFSDAEQLAIRRIWQRVAEDYAPFDIDVTTERPAVFNTRTAHVLITRNTDANGDPNPSSTAGGVAYLNVFGTTSYASYRPVWVYHNNLGNEESYIAEAVAHEVGHNFGLTHDGKTDGAEYYGGHGSGEISWAPLMGTGYNRNVSHWCKGEYHLANNTQDDLATLAGKIGYRADDHGNTHGTATPLAITGGTNIVVTTPETDPNNTQPANKGVLERNTDVDIFWFVTGSGPVDLAVSPWIVPGGRTRGGNLDLRTDLYNEAGTLLLSDNPATQTGARIRTNLVEGRYYLHVRNSDAGDPFNSTPTGYTAYGSLGQYFISGTVAPFTEFVTPPVAELDVADLTQPGQTLHPFTVTYSDAVALDVHTLDADDLRITGPNGYDCTARFLAVEPSGNGTPRVATYAAEPPGGNTWSPAHNGAYTISMRGNQVANTEGVWVAPGELGQFTVTVPSTPPGLLEVNPLEGLNAAGTAGGPFSPASVTYTLANTGGSALDWTASPSQDWVSLSTTAGTLAAGTATTVTVSINEQAENLEPGNYSDSVSLINATSGDGTTLRPVVLMVDPPVISLTGVAFAGQFQVTLRSQPHLPLVIEVSPNLLEWTVIVTNITGADGRLTYVDADADRRLTRYYRGRSTP